MLFFDVSEPGDDEVIAVVVQTCMIHHQADETQLVTVSVEHIFFNENPISFKN